MQREAHSDRGWEQWPGRRGSEDGGRRGLRALFLPSETSAGEAAQLAAVHSRELEEGLSALRLAVSELETRERAVSELEAGIEQVLRDGSVDLDQFQLELETRARALDARDRTLSDAESDVEERRRELGAVELKRAALEQRGAGLEEREAALEERADELTALARQLRELGASLAEPDADHDEAAHLLLTSDDGYRIVAADGASPAVGDRIELGGQVYRCVRVSGSPYPSDDRRCAVLDRADEEPAPG